MVSVIGISLTFICSLIVLAIGIFIPILIQELIQSSVASSVQMTSANQQLWASVPGETGVDILRNFTFYDFKNFYQVMFGKEQPILDEIEPVSYLEKYEFINKIYSDDGERVHFQDQIYFVPTFGTTGKEKIKTIKLGTMGAWYQMKNADMAQIALSAFYELFHDLKEQIIPSVVAQGVQGYLFPDAKSTQNILKKHVTIPISEDQMTRLTEDPNFAICKDDTFYNWILMSCDFSNGDISKAQPTNGAWTFLQNYFGLTSNQMEDIQSIIWSGTKLNPIKPAGAKTIYGQIISGYYCSNQYPDLPCNGDTLAAAQWTGQGVTYYPPNIPLMEIPKIDSIADTNSTIFGFPEISYYFKQCFLDTTSFCHIEGGDGEIFKNQFTNSPEMAEWGIKVMKELTDGEYIKTDSALLNIGNLRQLFNYGNQFEKSQVYYDKSEDLQKFQNKLQLKTKEQAFIFWNYMKYLVVYFAEMKQWNGNAGSAALGSLVSGGLTDNFVQLVNVLQPSIISTVLQNQYKTQECTEIFQYFDQNIALNICQKYLENEKELTQDNVQNIMQVCTLQNQEQVNNFLQKSGLDGEDDGMDQFNAFCTDITSENSFAKDYFTVGTDLSQKYKCTMYGMTCSNWDLALIQWVSSQVTSDLAPCMENLFEPSSTISDWYKNIFPTPFEYGWFADNYSQFGDGEIEKLTFENALNLVNYNKLLSGPMVSAGFLWELGDNLSLKIEFSKTFFVREGKQLLNYFRYLALEVTFGGFIVEKTADELLFGYQDEFLHMMKTMNPQEGGDPSIEDIVQFNEPNMTKPEMAQNLAWAQEMYTGVGTLNNVRQFYSVADQRHIVVTQNMFDGNNTYLGQFNPYASKVQVKGTDGTAFQPNLKKDDTIDVFIPTLFMGKTLYYDSNTKNNGLECLRFQTDSLAYANSTTNPENAPYYANGPNGVINMTSVMGAPVFNSQTHFYEGDTDLYNNITVLKNGKKQFPSKWDETYIDVEKYSGTVLSVVLNIQVNFEMIPDLLFPLEHPRYIPIYWMYRASNWTDAQADAQFGDLKTGLNVKIIIEILGLSLGGLLVILGIALIFKYKIEQKKIKKENAKKFESNFDTENNNQETLLNQSQLEENDPTISNLINQNRINNNDRSEYNKYG